MASAALALCCAQWTPAHAQDAPADEPKVVETEAGPETVSPRIPDGEVVGRVTLSADPGPLAAGVREVAGRVLAWCELSPEAAWGGLAEAATSDGETASTEAWELFVSDLPGVRPVPSDAPPAMSAANIVFDVLLDCNALRGVSEQPFSRSPRGRALDALTIDNARRARLTGVYRDPDDTSQMTLVLFAQSRALSPGRWRVRPIAEVRFAPNRGDPVPPIPIEIAFGEQWGGVLLAGADLAIGLDPASETRSTAERMEAWGQRRVGALRSLARGLDGRVWMWPGASAESGVVCSLPLSRGATDRGIADALRTIFGRRLAWGRDEDGRALGTLAICREDRPPEAGDQMLSLRFITIAERTTLTIATSAADLDAAPERLADIPQ